MQVHRYIYMDIFQSHQQYDADIVMEETKEIDTICGTHRMDIFN